MRAIRMVLLAAGLLAPLPLTAQDRTLTVVGQGQVTAVPDIADVQIGVTTEAGTAAEALASNSAAMQAVMGRLTAEGIEDADMQTSSLTLGPRFADGGTSRPTITAYVARNVLTVRVREIERLGAILDASGSEGANTFEGLSFGLADRSPVADEALRLAVADARRKAGIIATEAGVALGHVVGIGTPDASPRPMEMATARMAADSVPVAAGELAFGASVTVVFALGD